MKKILLVMVVTTFSLLSHAQSGNNQIGIAFEAGLPTSTFGDGFKTGFGGSVKGMFGIGTAGQVTLTSGYTSFKAKGDMGSGVDVTASIIPILVGYRHNLSGFYVEPQVGMGIYGSKISGTGSFDGSSSTSAFTWAAGIGYVVSGFDLGVRYQSASKDGETTSLVGLHVGYNFSLSGSK
jgi:hypothetical protein